MMAPEDPPPMEWFDEQEYDDARRHQSGRKEADVTEPMTVKEIVVAIDEGSNEAIYVDGVRWSDEGDTAYACDLAEAADGKPCTLEHRSVRIDPDADWPEQLSDLEVDPHEGG